MGKEGVMHISEHDPQIPAIHLGCTWLLVVLLCVWLVVVHNSPTYNIPIVKS